VTEARVTRNPVIGKPSRRFWSGSRPGDWPTDRSGADAAVAARCIGGRFDLSGAVAKYGSADKLRRG
jgi:hypothetical protein